MFKIEKDDPSYVNLINKYQEQFDTLLEEVCTYNPNCNRELLNQAFDFGIWAHRNQLRYSGEPYFEHCLNVATILSKFRMDSTTITAGLLHDVVEDTGFTMDDIKEMFGKDIANLVNGVTKISEISGRKSLSLELRQAETFRKMLLSMARDIRVIIIKFADRLHNMRTLQHVAARKRLRIALETRDVYAPLAHRFGMAQLKSELEDLSFKFIDNKAFTDLSKRLSERKDEREDYIQHIINPIKEEIQQHNISAEVQGRPKHFYSIYRKMKARNKPLEEIYDLFAIRIIVNEVAECYYVLGIIHNLFIPVYERFKDYIAMPKFNGYQSLHTTVVDKRGRMIEVQIRTVDMHRIAEMGIAAHWRYKEGKVPESGDEFDDKLIWVRQLLEQYEDGETVDARDFLDSLKINLYQDEVFVFTPKGDVIKLPTGATPVDFAFGIHTNVGIHCIGAKVNGKIVPLKYVLNSGDQVEIITSQNQHPNQDWLTFVKTSKARHHVRKYLREVQFDHSVKLGEEILSKYLKRYHIKINDGKLDELVHKLHFEDPLNLKAAIGRGDLSIEKIFSIISDEKLEEPRDNLLNKFLRRGKKKSAVQVEGVDNIVVHIGKCCEPVPGDDIIGYLTKGKGVTIHRTNCHNIQRLIQVKDRTIQVNWTVEIDEKFKVQLSLLAEDRTNLLRDITQSISAQNTNIIHVDLRAKDRLVTGKLIVEVKNLPHLTRIINAISKIKGILSVERVEGAAKKKAN
ncbi:MAG: bifunctional (p)ppGpp synthetase/guanosine-3',5'-bis(diphosphate) 3'-pyrophosphohydrolase [Calditrichaeota bacterium]|nr:bifunctional (p)ppGpp synthetase/guanosine-3',5'-bis(diphosphate) 3'-pyrophosphohydrolase [Calditrichota bacterium]